MTNQLQTILQDVPAEQSFASPASKKLALVGVIGLFLVFLASALLRLPESEYVTICGFKNFTGLPCPGCGLTHSFCALGKGAIGEAFVFNLLGPPLFFALFLLWIRSGCVLFHKAAVVQYLDRIARRLKIVKTFAVGFAIFGIGRIVYLLLYNPLAFRESPFSHLIARFIQ